MMIRFLMKLSCMILLIGFLRPVKAQKTFIFGANLLAGIEQPLAYRSLKSIPFQAAGPLVAAEFSLGLKLGSRFRISLPINYSYTALPKSKNYDNDCLQEFFPTYESIHDTIMGRDIQKGNLGLGFRGQYQISRSGITIGAGFFASFLLNMKFEDYAKVCNGSRERSFIQLVNTPARDIRKINIAWEALISFPMKKGERFTFNLEPGFRMFLLDQIHTASELLPQTNSQLRTVSIFTNFAVYFQ